MEEPTDSCERAASGGEHNAVKRGTSYARGGRPAAAAAKTKNLSKLLRMPSSAGCVRTTEYTYAYATTNPTVQLVQRAPQDSRERERETWTVPSVRRPSALRALWLCTTGSKSSQKLFLLSSGSIASLAAGSRVLADTSYVGSRKILAPSKDRKAKLASWKRLRIY